MFSSANLMPGGVDQVHTALPAGVERVDGLVFVEGAKGAAQTIGAKAEPRNRLAKKREGIGLHFKLLCGAQKGSCGLELVKRDVVGGHAKFRQHLRDSLKHHRRTT